jgi:hypothetical protein
MKNLLKALILTQLLFLSTIITSQSTGVTYHIQSAVGGKFLDVKSANRADGTPLHLWPFNGSVAQRFKLEDAGGGWFYIKSDLGKYVHIENASNSPQALAVIWQGKGNNNTKWRFENVGGGYFLIQSLVGTYLDVKGGFDADGTPIWMWTKNGGAAQRWKLVFSGDPINNSTRNVSTTSRTVSQNKALKGEIVRGNARNKSSITPGAETVDSDARRVCVTNTITLDESPQKDIGFLVTSGDHDQIYPGAIFKQNTFIDGSDRRPNLNYNPFNIVVSLVSATSGKNSATITPDQDGSVSKSNSYAAMAEILNANTKVRNPTNFSYTVHKIESAQDLSVMAYGEFSGFGADVKAEFNYAKKARENMYVVRFHQKYYSFLVDSKNFINRTTSPNKVQSDDVYISEVSYGRIGFIKIESKYDLEIIQAAVDAAYSSIGYSAKLRGKVDWQTLKNEWKFTAYAVGGASRTFSTIEAFQGWVKAADWNPIVAQVPIGYKLKFLDNNQIADVRMTSSYPRRECRPYTSTKITFLGLGYLNIVNGHDHGDCSRIGMDVDVEMMVTGKRSIGKNDRGMKTNRIVSWREYAGYEKGKPVWKARPEEIVKLHEKPTETGEKLVNFLKSENKTLEFIIDQNELEKNNVTFRIQSKIESCHKSGGLQGGFHCDVTTVGGNNSKEFRLKNLLSKAGNNGNVRYFDTGIISGTGDHTWKLYFKVEND